MTRQAYDFAFRVGALGTAFLVGAAIWGPTLYILAVTSAWTMMILFGLPWLYTCYQKGKLRVPPWFYKGPHQ